jgi:hypothetical protein
VLGQDASGLVRLRITALDPSDDRAIAELLG